MNKIIAKTTIALLVTILLVLSSSCDDSSKGDIASIGLKEAKYDNANLVMYLSLKDDATLQLTPVVTPHNAPNQKLLYKHKYPNLMSVSEDGLITGIAPGIDTLIIQTTDGSNLSAFYRVILIDHIVKATEIKVSSDGRNVNLEMNTTFDLAPHITVGPADVWDNTVTYASTNELVLTVDPNTGVITPIAEGFAKVVITTADGSNITTECNVTVVDKITGPISYERATWVVSETSHPYAPDGTTGKPEDLFDGDKNTFLSLYKSKDGQTNVPVGEPLFFVLDMGEAKIVEFVMMSYREKVSSKNLRLKTGTLFGSTDNVNFVQIGEAGRVFNEDTLENTFLIDEADVKEYRYIKLTYDTWNDAGGTVQFSEINVGYFLK